MVQVVTHGFVPAPFAPAPGCDGAHRQTLAARLLRPSALPPMARTRLETPDGDFVDLDFPYPEANGRRPGALVLLLHGLEGSARSKYALETYRRLHAVGIRAVGLNFRSCSGELNRRPRLYHSGETSDVGFVIEWLLSRYPDVRLGVVGFSLGGNALLKYLGERGDGVPDAVVAAATVSVPFDLAAGSVHLERPGGWPYVRFLLGKLRRKTAAKRALLESLIDVDRAVRARTFRVFDEVATAPLHGFAGADDYYARCSSAAYLSRIRRPVLLLQARDDPFLPDAAVPDAVVRANPMLHPAFLERGGHVGFLGGTLSRPHFWAEAQVARYFDAVFG